jgi:hypothetical protein
VRPIEVVVVHEFAEYVLEMVAPKDQHPVEVSTTTENCAVIAGMKLTES